MNAQQLKNAILQEAIEGRLVPQDPNDEPASVLLARIRKEKERLVKEGKLKKKDLEVKPISEDEIPFEIPESWEWVRLGAITTVLGGKRIPAGRKLSQNNTGHVYIRVSDMKDGMVSMENLQYVPEDIFPSISRYIINKEDVFITVAGTIGRIGKIPPELDGANLTENADRLVFTIIDQDWLIKCLQSVIVQSQISAVTTQVGQPKLAILRIQNLLIPLPPVEEQKRIVAKIDELLPKVEEYGKAQDALNKLNAELPERLKKSILQEAIEGRLVPQDPNDEPASVLLAKIRKEKERLVKEGKLKKKDLIETPISEDEIPFEIPDSWEWVRLSNVVNIIMGQSPDGDDVYESEYDDNAFEFHQGKICFTERFISSSGKWCKNPSRIAEKGSLLVCVRAPIGDVNITQRIISIGRGLASLTGYCGIQTLFLFFWVIAHKRVLEDKGTGSTFKAITIEVLKNQLIPLPPLAEQHRIVEKLEQVLGKIGQLKT